MLVNTLISLCVNKNIHEYGKICDAWCYFIADFSLLINKCFRMKEKKTEYGWMDTLKFMSANSIDANCKFGKLGRNDAI